MQSPRGVQTTSPSIRGLRALLTWGELSSLRSVAFSQLLLCPCLGLSTVCPQSSLPPAPMETPWTHFSISTPSTDHSLELRPTSSRLPDIPQRLSGVLDPVCSLLCSSFCGAGEGIRSLQYQNSRTNHGVASPRGLEVGVEARAEEEGSMALHFWGMGWGGSGWWAESQ